MLIAEIIVNTHDSAVQQEQLIPALIADPLEGFHTEDWS
jgi:hypothetical protein